MISKRNMPDLLAGRIKLMPHLERLPIQKRDQALKINHQNILPILSNLKNLTKPNLLTHQNLVRFEVNQS
jgi:hypothetical protein